MSATETEPQETTGKDDAMRAALEEIDRLKVELDEAKGRNLVTPEQQMEMWGQTVLDRIDASSGRR